jgi:hypothetical protein
MDSPLSFTWEQIRNTVNSAVFQQFGEYLSDAEIEVLQGSWDGLTYEKMAESLYRSVNYVRGDIGPKLWSKLSIALVEEVRKKNIKSVLERAYQKQISAENTDIQTTVYTESQIPFPEGSVPLGSPFYLEREGVESVCYEAIAKPGSLTRIKAPKLMGKTSLMVRILAQAESQNYCVVPLEDV